MDESDPLLEQRSPGRVVVWMARRAGARPAMAHIADPSYPGLMWVRGTVAGVLGLLSAGCATPCVDDGFLAMQHDSSCLVSGASSTTSGESTSSATTAATSGTDTTSGTTAATTGPGSSTIDATGTGTTSTTSTTDAGTGSTSAVSGSTTDSTSTTSSSSGSSTTLDPMGDDDGDAVPNGLEQMVGIDPTDRDSDDDGILDGVEFSITDFDNDGLIVPLDPDSDDDGLLDGTEVGTACDDPDTDPAICVADADPGANTNPLDPDSDGGGAPDGTEDWNLNGKRDMGETDNTLGDDDVAGPNADGDGDGLSDNLETTLGSNPVDADSDDDGVMDGLEKNPSLDHDGDTKLGVLDPDSDNDALFDGTELGFDCSLPGTDNVKMQCVADADNGFTSTRVLRPDTDGGGTPDGAEDKNHNGQIDAMETDPNNPADD